MASSSPWKSSFIRLTSIVFLISLQILQVSCQDCSATKLCATGCCSQYGFCGTDSAHCGAGCLSTCNYKLGCDANNPCAPGTGCCSKFGFCGLGPDYCAPEVCVAGCDSKSYCDPGYTSAGYAEVEHCPLNVCCSKWGFCGLTEDFCGNKTVARPSCGDTGTISRVIGYYEGWATGRACEAFPPEQILTGAYTHINFAFASIDPFTFQVVPASSGDVNLYTRLTGLKRLQPDLKVFIAIGGWTFNDPGPTATTFSDLAGSATNQAAFFESLISFMSTYDFDGVDIDWEYPEALDRSGRGQDFANFPSFLSNLKQALQSTGGRDGLSITIPASYWYLQHFDIINIANTVDWFNMMTYDLHGSWDIGNKWLGAYLNAHTNLTEIKDSLDLLWRNGISSSQVNLGLAFYGRTSTTIGGCVAPGCVYASAGKAGPCSESVGTLTNAEIADVISSRSLTPSFNLDAAVKIISWDDQWVAYDDGDTFQLKVNYAKSVCLGGVFVWAISQDSSDSASTKGLANAVGRSIVPALEITTDDPNPIVNVPDWIKQCKWSGCDIPCSWYGWNTVRRDDSWANYDGEPMQDDNFCDGAGTRSFCCPPNRPQPSCGWYSHRGGNCDSTCPPAYVEVGSTQAGCRDRNTYQAACCRVADPLYSNEYAATALYGQCEWSGEPYFCAASCDTQNGYSQLVSSWDGSGAVFCRPIIVNHISFGFRQMYEQRPYCCNQPVPTKSWDRCGWYTKFGAYPKNQDPTKFCQSDCPPDFTRVALWKGYFTSGSDCVSNGGAGAYCCNSSYIAQVQVQNPELDKLANALADWVSSPTCPADVGTAISKRDIHTNASHPMYEVLPPHLISRGAPTSDEVSTVLTALGDLFRSALNSNPYVKREGQLWDIGMGIVFPGLLYVTMLNFLPTWAPAQVYTADELANTFMCKPNSMNARLGGNTAFVSCSVDYCSYTNCEDPEDEDRPSQSLYDDDYDDSGDFYKNRRRSIDLSDTPYNGSSPTDILPYTEDDYKYLEKRARGPTRSFAYYSSTGQLVPITWPQPDWHSAGSWPANAPIYSEVYILEDVTDCSNSRLRVVRYTLMPANTVVATEHIIEGNTPQRFFSDRNEGVLPSGQSSRFAPQPGEFFGNWFTRSWMHGLQPLPGGLNPTVPAHRLMETLGSRRNIENFVILLQTINLMKSRLWRHVAARDSGDMATMVRDLDHPHMALNTIREVIAVYQYYNDPIVHRNLVRGANSFRAELGNLQNAYNAVTLGAATPINLVGPWDEWFRDHLRTMTINSLTFVNNNIAAMRQAHRARPTNPITLQVFEHLTQLAGDASLIDFNIFLDGLDGADWASHV